MEVRLLYFQLPTINMLQFYVCIMLVLSISKCFCDIINVYHVPCEKKDAFQSTWNIIKSQVPMHWDLRRSKRTGTTTTSTTERSSYILEIPILPAPKSRYQDLYRIKQPPSPKNNLETAPQWYRKSEQHAETSTTIREASDNSVYYIDFKNFKVKFFYNINLDF